MINGNGLIISILRNGLLPQHLMVLLTHLNHPLPLVLRRKHKRAIQKRMKNQLNLYVSFGRRVLKVVRRRINPDAILKKFHENQIELAHA